jgi:hypothetical protein
LFSDLFGKYLAKGLTNETEICHSILESAQRTSAEWNKHVGVDNGGDDSCLDNDQKSRTKRVHRILFTSTTSPSSSSSSLKGMTYLDAHYSVNGGATIRVRMNQVKGGSQGEYECCQVKITPRDTVSYWFSYGGHME